MFNKKGTSSISEHVLLWIPKFVYLVIVVLSVVFLVRMLVANNIDSTEAEARIFANRIFYSPNSISYFDPELSRAYPGIIDFAKFNSMQNSDVTFLDTSSLSYGKDNRLIAAKLSLKNMETREENDVYYNKENYLYWEPRTIQGVSGSGSVNAIDEQRYVLIKSGEKLSGGKLRINIIVRR